LFLKILMKKAAADAVNPFTFNYGTFNLARLIKRQLL
jgi:hypothetical protein